MCMYLYVYIYWCVCVDMQRYVCSDYFPILLHYVYINQSTEFIYIYIYIPYHATHTHIYL